MLCRSMLLVFFFEQKTAYAMRISDWSSDVCSSDLERRLVEIERLVKPQIDRARHAAFDLIGGLRLEHVDALQRLRGQILEVERPAGGGEDLASVGGRRDIRKAANLDTRQLVVAIVGNLDAGHALERGGGGGIGQLADILRDDRRTEVRREGKGGVRT